MRGLWTWPRTLCVERETVVPEGDKDSLFDQTLVRLLKLLLGLSVHLLVESSFSKSPAKSV